MEGQVPVQAAAAVAEAAGLSPDERARLQAGNAFTTKWHALVAPLTAPFAGAGGGWLVSGVILVVVAAIVIDIGPAGSVAGHGGSVFLAASGFSSLAGFTFLAAALERIAEFTLAPWWGKADAKPANVPALLAGVPSKALSAKVGVADAAALQQTAKNAKTRNNPAAPATTPGADSVYVTATKQRPTIMLPMAGAAAVVCSYLHLYLLHSLAKSGLPDTRLAFLGDGLLTGFALAGGAQPFHDLIGSLSSSSTAKQAAAKSSS